jgi:hypothetical protein
VRVPKAFVRSLNLHFDFFAFPAACHKSSLPYICKAESNCPVRHTNYFVSGSESAVVGTRNTQILVS